MKQGTGAHTHTHAKFLSHMPSSQVMGPIYGYILNTSLGSSSFSLDTSIYEETPFVWRGVQFSRLRSDGSVVSP